MEESKKSDTQLSEEATRYVRSNVKKIIEKWAGDKTYSPEEGIAVSVFMAGSPGAGKTEISKQLLNIFEKNDGRQKVVRIDTDEIRISLPQYIPGRAEVFQRAASLAVDKVHDYVLKANKNFILDSTFSNYERAVLNIDRSLRRNRAVFIFYIYLDPVKAWDYTQKRERLEGRNIRKEDFIAHFCNAKNVVNRVKKKFGKKIIVNVIERDTATDNIKLSLNVDSIDNYIKMKYNKESLENNLKSTL